MEHGEGHEMPSRRELHNVARNDPTNRRRNLRNGVTLLHVNTESESKTKVELGPIQTTLLIPLLDRAEETKKARPLLSDQKAVDIVSALDYDFDKWRNLSSQSAACIRARLFDEIVQDFLKQYPEGSVIEIGAGLNTRYERLDNGKSQWLELDLPDSMQLRRQFFEDTKRRTMISASVIDTDWHEQVRALPAPYCFVSEAVIIYLDNDVVEQAIRGLAKAFPDSWLVTDTMSKKIVEGQHKHEIMKTLPRESWFRWHCDDPRDLKSWGATLERSMTYVDAPKSVRARFPFKWRLQMALLPWLVRRIVDGYRINRFTLSGK